MMEAEYLQIAFTQRTAQHTAFIDVFEQAPCPRCYHISWKYHIWKNRKVCVGLYMTNVVAQQNL